MLYCISFRLQRYGDIFKLERKDGYMFMTMMLHRYYGRYNHITRFVNRQCNTFVTLMFCERNIFSLSLQPKRNRKASCRISIHNGIAFLLVTINYAIYNKVKMKKKTYLFIALSIVSMGMNAQNSEKSSLENNVPEFVKTMKIGGTIRSKYEYQTEEGEGRFEVRTARINVAGNVTKEVSYKAEIDLCDEGKIKMLDAYTRIKPWKTLQLTIGQERVPFTIDAHRSPHQQYFANRSFIAKQVGNVRDVGAEIGYTWNVGFPIVVNAGIFNGSGLTNQKDYWTKGVNYSAKAQFLFPNVNLVLSTQKIKPSDVTVTMYDGGITFHKGGFIAEAEYLYKHYSKDAFHDVHAFDGFVCYDIPVANPKSLIRKVSPLARYDFMSDHSDGTRYGGSDTELGALKINDYKRHRVTGGVTLSLAKPFISDIRINYEKYFYRKGGIAKVSEKDKIVVEFMTKF